jgi:hydroxymethylpyrimidine/phosphomethylpyrimidine kinase
MRIALTVAGSDSGGGAGIQADLKTFHALGVFGTSAITCLTAQHPGRLSAVFTLTPEFVSEQMDRVFEAFPVRGAKTGMLYEAAIIAAVAGNFRARKFRRLVVDPVMVASSGARLLEPSAIDCLKAELLPLAAVVTPNLAEAEVLCGGTIRSLAELRAAARELAGRFHVPFLVKGGHLPGTDRAVDILVTGRKLREFAAPMVRGVKTHGTGCTFSAAIAAGLAVGCDLAVAVARAKRLVTRAIDSAVRVGRYHALRI